MMEYSDQHNNDYRQSNTSGEMHVSEYQPYLMPGQGTCHFFPYRDKYNNNMKEMIINESLYEHWVFHTCQSRQYMNNQMPLSPTIRYSDTIRYRDNHDIKKMERIVDRNTRQPFRSQYPNKTKYNPINETFGLENVYIDRNKDEWKGTKDSFKSKKHGLKKYSNKNAIKHTEDSSTKIEKSKQSYKEIAFNFELHEPSRSKITKRKKKFFHDLTLQEKSHYVALDCEMVGVGPFGNKSALARVCVIDWDYSILIDTFVIVEEPVTDYRTRVSGVKAEDIYYGLPINHVRNLVLRIIKDKVLIGHGLKCDLEALGITHPWQDLRDSTMFPLYTIIKYPGQNPRARKLRELAKEFLDLTIQEGEHSPDEDATVAFKLYKLKYGEWESLYKFKVGKTRAILKSESPVKSC